MFLWVFLAFIQTLCLCFGAVLSAMLVHHWRDIDAFDRFFGAITVFIIFGAAIVMITSRIL